jgi:NACHT domain
LVCVTKAICCQLFSFLDSSSVIEDVRHMCQTGLSTLAIFYFDFRDAAKQDARSLLSSLLIQLCDQSDNSSQVLFSLYTAHADGSRQPSEDALMECLKNVLKLPGQGTHYIIIDALDECPNSYGLTSPRAEVLKIVRELVELRLPHVHFCITSRLEIGIRDVLEPLANHNVTLHNEKGQNQDIIDYVNSVVHSHPTMCKWRDEDKKLVIDTLIARAGGM